MQIQNVPVAIIQHPPVFLNLAASVDRAIALIAEAALQGARLIAFPETWLPGYPIWLDFAPNAALWDYPPAKALYRILAENALIMDCPYMDKLMQCAEAHHVLVVMGAQERLGNSLYNSIFYIEGGKVSVHRKLMPTYTEKLIWGRGDGSTLQVVPQAYGAVGALVCWEHWMPLARAAMHAQHEVIHVAQWPMVKALHQLASRTYAFEGQCFVLAAGTVLRRGDVLEGFNSLGLKDSPALDLLNSIPGEDADFIHRGGSAIIAPDTRYIEGPLFDEAGILYAELDLAEIEAGHMVMDTAGHYARPDVFSLNVNTAPQVDVTGLTD